MTLSISKCVKIIQKKNADLLKILLYNPIFFLFPKFLELFFTPKNTPPEPKNSKLDKIPIFFGTPCRKNNFGTQICTSMKFLLSIVLYQWRNNFFLLETTLPTILHIIVIYFDIQGVLWNPQDKQIPKLYLDFLLQEDLKEIRDGPS